MNEPSGNQAGTATEAPPARRGTPYDRFMRNSRQFVGIAFVFAVSFLGQPRQDWWVAGLVLIGVGMLIRLWASGFVKKDKQLAMEGPYSLVRHPLYVGNLLIGFGFCFASGLVWSFPAFVAVLVLFYPPAIRMEDAKLHGLFGTQWETWRASTRALIPTLPPAGPLTGPWSFRQSLIQNGEPVYVLIFVGLVYYLQRQF